MVRQSQLLAAVPGLVHGFTTRRGPSWSDPERGFDLGPGAEPRDWAWVAEELGLPGAAGARVSQVHGAEVVHAGAGGRAGQADAVWTELPGLLVAVRVADCVPVLVADLDPAGRALRVAAIHAGWRGLAAGTIPAALAALGPTRGRRLAVVGPRIGVDAYEVGPEVVEGLAVRVPVEVFARPGRRPGRHQADLGAAAAWQLRGEGVDALEVMPDCTASDPALHSHRRDATASGRIAAVVGLAC